MRTLITLLTISSGLLSLNAGALAQKRDSKVDKASQRSSLAAEVLTNTINLPDNTIPKELLEKAKAIGVFPDFERISIVMPKTRLSYGVVSRRLENGWTTPAYYGFGFRELETLNARGSKKPDMIVLFMTDRCIDALLKGRVPLMNDLVGVAGPVGNDIPENIDETNVLVYTIIDGQVKGIKVDANNEGGIINPDNNINEAIYGMKAQDIIAGKGSINPQVLTAISAYRDALVNMLKAQ